MAVIPSGTSEPWFWLAREAAANDALARMYHQLNAKKEDRARQEALAMKMFQLRNAEHDRRFNMRYPEGPDYTQNNPLYGGGASSDRGSDTPAASKGTTSGSGAKTIPGGVPILTPGTFQKTSTIPGGDSYAQADGGGDFVKGAADNETIEVSSQNVRPPQRDKEPYRPRSGTATNTQLPKQPSRKQRQNQAMFLPIPEQVHQAMENAEKKYGLPSGTMLTTLGYENGGGRVYGQNPNSSAMGWYQFTDALRKTYNLTPADTQDIFKMTEIAARNMRRNAMQLENSTRVGNNPGIKLGNSAADIPSYLILHKYGATDGPLVVAAAKKNDTMLMKDVMFQKPGRDNARVLINNKIPGDATVKDVMNIETKQLSPWMYSAIELQNKRSRGEAPQMPSGDTTQQTIPTTTRGEPALRPPAEISSSGVNPRLVAAINGGAAYLPDGYKVVPTSGRRSGGDPRSHHHRGNALDVQIIAPDGTRISNKGEDTTGMYTRLARGVKTWATENDPQLASRIGYGGAFGTRIGGGGVPDLMHYDLGGSRGRMRPEMQFANLKPLSPEERGGTTQVAQAPKQAPQRQQVAQGPADWEKLPSVASTRDFTKGAPKSAPLLEAGSMTALNPYKDAMSATAAVNPQDVPIPRARPSDVSPPPAPTDPNVPLPRPRDSALGSDADAGAFDQGGSLGTYSEAPPSMRARREGPSEPVIDAEAARGGGFDEGGYTSAESAPEPQTQANMPDWESVPPIGGGPQRQAIPREMPPMQGGDEGIPTDDMSNARDLGPGVLDSMRQALGIGTPPAPGGDEGIPTDDMSNNRYLGPPMLESIKNAIYPMASSAATSAGNAWETIQQAIAASKEAQLAAATGNGQVPRPPAPPPAQPTQPTQPIPPQPTDVPLPPPRPPSAPQQPVQPTQQGFRERAIADAANLQARAIADKDALLAAIFGKKGAATAVQAKPAGDPNAKRIKTERFDRDMVSKDKMPDGSPVINPQLKIIIDPKPKGSGQPDMGIGAATTMPGGAGSPAGAVPIPQSIRKGQPIPFDPNTGLIEVPDTQVAPEEVE